MKNKVCDSFDKAVTDIPDGASVMMMSMGGPGGIPQNLILALRDRGVKNLDVYACPNFGYTGPLQQRPGFKPYVTPDILAANGQVSKAHVSWARGGSGEYLAMEESVLSGKIELEVMPLGAYCLRLRAGGSGVGAFYSPVGVGTIYAQGKEQRVVGGREFLLEYPIRADFGFVRAYKADKLGNLIYRGTSRCFNPLIAKSCNVTIAEVDEILEAGELEQEQIITPGICIDRIVKISEEEAK